jgi:hydroxypyruvate isomerase
VPRFAANLSFMFNEYPFLERFEAAAEAGFQFVEFLFPYDYPVEQISECARQAGVQTVLFNLPPGDWDAGERGIAALPSRVDELREGLARALPYMRAMGVKQLHLMAGFARRGDPTIDRCYREAVRWCAQQLEQEGVNILLEPINGRDMPGYYLNDVDAAGALIEELALPNVKLQLDVYHAQVLQGDITRLMRQWMPLIGHVQIASVPARHEPDAEELNYPFLFSEFDRLGYTGFIGAEYRPRARTEDGLAWFAPYRHAARVQA